jgi:uncharacterized protein YdaU (DUF1376 family)
MTLNRSPAFQFYPDKWQSHTRRLSNDSYRVFHELLCWMWQSSPDYCSVDASPEAVAVAVAMPVECVRIALAEIQNAFAPLLQCEDNRWVSNGLRKEAVKQDKRRVKAQESANARWKDADASNTNANASAKQCFPVPVPVPVPKKEKRESDASLSPPSQKPSVALSEIFDAWNTLDCGVPKSLVVSDKRRRTLQLRLHEPFFAANWRPALVKIAVSPFLRGENDRGWRATFDWFITPDAVPKIMEGKYDRPTNQISRPNHRNDGIVVGPTDYATLIPKRNRDRIAAEAKAAAEADAARMAGQMDLPPATAPATC